MSVSRSHFQISCFGVFGPLKSVRRPQDVIYFLKAMTNSFHTISKVYFAKCTRLTHLLCFASLFVIHWHVNMYIEQSPNLHSWLYNFFNSPEYFRLFFFWWGGGWVKRLMVAAYMVRGTKEKNGWLHYGRMCSCTAPIDHCPHHLHRQPHPQHRHQHHQRIDFTKDHWLHDHWRAIRESTWLQTTLLANKEKHLGPFPLWSFAFK